MSALRMVMLPFLAVVVSLITPHITSYAQQPPTEPLPFWFPDRLTLRGPGSQIGVSARELKTSEMEWQGRLRAPDPKDRPSGVILEEVQANGPAARAGLLKGDIIFECDGLPVRGLRHFYRLVEETPPGWTVRANIVRNGKIRDVLITPVMK